MKKSVFALSFIAALSVFACGKPAQHDHNMPPADAGKAPVAMSEIPSEVRAVGDLKIEVQAPWARATVAGQTMGGAFVNLKSDQDAVLVGATSPASESVELHTMKMDGEKMVMAQVPNIPLPANSVVELKPGSLHIMFMSLKAPLKEGDVIPLKLEIKNKAGQSAFLELQAPVKAMGEPMPMKMAH